MQDAARVVQERVAAWSNVFVPLLALLLLISRIRQDPLLSISVVFVLAWAVVTWLAFRRPWLKLVEIGLIITAVAAFDPYLVKIAMAANLWLGISTNLRFGLAAGATLALGCMAVSVGLHAADPARAMLPLLASALLFGLGRVVRVNLLARIHAERFADRTRETNVVLLESLRFAETLAASRERARIAQELHDRLGHCLTTAHVHLQLAAREAGTLSPLASEALANAQDATQHGLAELRRCVAVLRDPATEKPLGQIMRELIATFPRECFTISLRIRGTERRLAADREFVLFRALQEALTNAAKHAEATRVEVCLSYGTGGTISLEIADDGVITMSDAAGIQAGFGLKGLAERVEAVDGRMAWACTSGAGFSLRVDMG